MLLPCYEEAAHEAAWQLEQQQHTERWDYSAPATTSTSAPRWCEPLGPRTQAPPPPKLAMKRVLVLSISPTPSRSRGWGRWVQPYATFQVGGWAGLAYCVAANVPPGQKNTTLAA